MTASARETLRLLGATLTLQLAAFFGLLPIASGLEESSLPRLVTDLGLMAFLHHLWLGPLILGLAWFGNQRKWLSDEGTRRLVIGYLAISTFVLLIPWSLALVSSQRVYGAPLSGPISGFLLVVAPLGMLISFVIGWSRNRLIGRHALAGSVITVLAWAVPLLVVGITENAGYDAGLGILFISGAWLWTGLLVQYPSMLWYAWKTPPDEWGDDRAERADPAVFEPARTRR